MSGQGRVTCSFPLNSITTSKSQLFLCKHFSRFLHSNDPSFKASRYTNINRYPSLYFYQSTTHPKCALPPSSPLLSSPWLLPRALPLTKPYVFFHFIFHHHRDLTCCSLSSAPFPSLPQSLTPTASPLSSPRPTLSVS